MSVSVSCLHELSFSHSQMWCSWTDVGLSGVRKGNLEFFSQCVSRHTVYHCKIGPNNDILMERTIVMSLVILSAPCLVWNKSQFMDRYKVMQNTYLYICNMLEIIAEPEKGVNLQSIFVSENLLCWVSCILHFELFPLIYI